MDLILSLKFPFDDQDWLKKIAIGSLLLITIIGSVAVVGWMIEIARRVIDGHPEPLPAWNDIGQFFIDGLKFMGVTFLWSLPIILVILGFALGQAITLSAAEQTPTQLPLQLFPLFFLICLFPLIMVFNAVLYLALPGIVALLAIDTGFWQVANPSHVFGLIRKSWVSFVIAGLLGWLGINSAAGLVGMFLCVVGVIPATVYVYAVNGHLAGQAFIEANKPNNAPLPPVSYNFPP